MSGWLKKAKNLALYGASGLKMNNQQGMDFNVGANILNPSPWTVAHAAGPELPAGYATDQSGNNVYIPQDNTPVTDPNAGQDPYTQDPYAGQTGGGGVAVAEEPAYVPEMITFKGIQYDLNNPNDRNAFIQIQSAEVDKQLSTALKSGQLGYASKLLDYKRSWESQGQTLKEGYNQGAMARQQNYQGLGTRAYQSSMGTSGQYALNKLGEAQNERNYQKDQFNSGLETAYNDWISGAQDTAQTNKDTMSTNVANIGGFNSSGVNNAQVKLDQYTPFTNFQQLASNPAVANQALGGKALAPVQQQTLSQYLQQIDPSKQADTLNQYLLGKV